jgi:hypothetical protein
MYITDQLEYTEGLLKTLRLWREEMPAGSQVTMEVLLLAHVSRLREEAAKQPSDVAAQAAAVATEALQRGRGALGKLLSAAGERLKS